MREKQIPYLMMSSVCPPPTKDMLFIFTWATAVQLAVGVILFVLYGKDVFYLPDTNTYVAPSLGLLQTGAFFTEGVAEIVRTPGYPLFLTPFLLFTHWEIIVVIAQSIIGGGVAVLTYRLAFTICNRRAGFLAALFFTLSPLTLAYTSLLLAERLFSFFNALSCVYFIFFIKERRLFALFLSALFTVCAIFVRPAALFIPWAFVLFMLCWGIWIKIGYRKIIVYILIFLLICVIPIKAWEHRNEKLSGYKGFSAISAVNMFFYNAAAVMAKQEGLSLPEMQERLGYFKMNIYYDKYPELKNIPIGQVYNKMEEAGKQIIKRNLLLYARIHLIGMVSTLLSPSPAVMYVRSVLEEGRAELAEMRENKSFAQFVILLARKKPLGFVAVTVPPFLLLAWYFLVVIGVAKSLPTHPAEVLFLLGVMGYFILISGGPAGYSRFRDPIGFIFAVFAGIGIEYLSNLKRHRRGSVVTNEKSS